MASNSSPEDRQNWDDNVFGHIPVGENEACLLSQFLAAHDLADNSRRAITNDLRKFAGWFSTSNQEPFIISRVTTRDVADFKTHLRRELDQAVSTVNRALVSIRRFFGWLVDQGHVSANPAVPVKELRKVELAPQGLEKSDVRKLLREVELRHAIRAGAIFHLFLYTGPRCGDVVGLELSDLMLKVRSGTAIFRHGKGNKQRSVPVPLPARQALQAYLDVRPPVVSQRLFIGERGPLTARGIRSLCDRYSVLTGVKIHPHLLRHTFAHSYLEANPGDLVGLAQILGHESLDTTARYTRKSENELGEAAEKLDY